MDVELMCVSEYATVGDGKITVAGVFDYLKSIRFPFSYNFYVTARIRFEREETLDPRGHTLKLEYKNDVGEEFIATASYNFKIAEAGVTETSNLQFVLRNEEAPFLTTGRMNISLFIDEKLVKTIPLYVGKEPS